MKNRGFMILSLIMMMLALTAAAQTNPNAAMTASSQATASQSTSSQTLEPLESPRPKDFWDGDDPNLFNLITHPFANKKYVQRQVTPIRDRINELEQITSENSDAIKDVDARAKKGIQMASDKSSLADQHSTDAANKAQLAQTAATEASNRVSADEKLVGNLDQYKGTAETEIRFRSGQTELSKDAKDALDQMAAPLEGQKSYIIEVRGFSAGRGQAAITSSQKMADSVVRYLVETHNIPVYRIYVLSMGDATAGSEGMAAKRIVGGRVEVNVMKNELAAQR
jgi:outer membrane protein OmpA-like peptidoglycan-associated protein